jgi:hypothetical protein
LSKKYSHPFCIVNLDNVRVEVGEYGGGAMVEDIKLRDFVPITFEKTYEFKNPHAGAAVCCEAVGATSLLFLVTEESSSDIYWWEKSSRCTGP